MDVGKRQYKLTVIILMLFFNNALAKPLDDFSSDGCSLFPDGTLSVQNLWCDCCFIHDIAYWQGGSRKQKELADDALRTCILLKTANSLLANIMYYGVVLGGSPAFPNWYRWGYGWRYGRGFKSLNRKEKSRVKAKLQHYRKSLSKSPSFCGLDNLDKNKATYNQSPFFNLPPITLPDF